MPEQVHEPGLVVAHSRVGAVDIAIEARWIARFGLSDDLANVGDAGDPDYRVVDLAAVFEPRGAPADEFGRRVVFLDSPAGGLALVLGKALRIRRFGAAALRRFPPFVASTAKRSGWTGLLEDEDRFLLILDPQALPERRAAAKRRSRKRRTGGRRG